MIVDRICKAIGICLIFEICFSLFQVRIQHVEYVFSYVSSIQEQPSEGFYKKAVLKHFAIFKGKNLRWEFLFDKVVGLQVCNFIKNRLQHRCFPVNNAKLLKTIILKNVCEWLLL